MAGIIKMKKPMCKLTAHRLFQVAGLSTECHLPQMLQVSRIRMGQRGIEVVEHGLTARAVLHGFVAGADSRRHFTLTHVAAAYGRAIRQVLTCGGQDFVEIFRRAAEARRAEQENLLRGTRERNAAVSASQVPLSVQKPT